MTTRIHHLDCGLLRTPLYSRVSCHCLLLEDRDRLALIDTGIGLHDVSAPLERIGQQLIDTAGFRFHERITAVRQIERLGFTASDVAHVVLTHGDPDHTGGLADFPNATVHLSTEELADLGTGRSRYLPVHFKHGVKWKSHPSSTAVWFGLEARPLELGFGTDVLLVPLFGHTLGHCGVAVRQGERWTLHVGDAYYLRVELSTDDDPVSALTAQSAEDDHQRRASLERLRHLVRDHEAEIDLFGTHDFTEFPPGFTLWEPECAGDTLFVRS